MTYLAIILASGNASRMGGHLKKSFCEIGNEALIIHLTKTVLSSNPIQLIIVINNTYTETEKQYIIDFIEKNKARDCKYSFAYQKNICGTADAVKSAIEEITIQEEVNDVIIFFSDCPFIEYTTLKNFRQLIKTSPFGVICGFNCESENQYARIVLNPQNEIERLVEYKDYKDNAEVKKITKCNSGVMGVKLDFLKANLPKIQNNNQAREYYLSELAFISDKKFNYFELTENEAIGINSITELEKTELTWQNQQRNYWLQNFVQLIDKNFTYFGFNNKIGRGTKIGRGVILGKNVTIGSDVEIQSYSVISDDVKIGDGTKIKPYSHIESSIIGKNCEIGPFTNLNGNNILGDKNIIGNFVEIKRTQIGSKNKAKHLSYIGNGTIGDNNNFGAGCIFCNYDGKEKHQTSIGNENMIGANVSLIAPLNIGNKNLVGAGSVISEGFDDNNLVIERSIQQTKKRKKNEDLSRS